MLGTKLPFGPESVIKILLDSRPFRRAEPRSADSIDYRWLASFGADLPAGGKKTTPPVSPSLLYPLIRSRNGRNVPSQRDLPLSPAELFARDVLRWYEKSIINTTVPTTGQPITVSWDDDTSSSATFHESLEKGKSGEDIGIQFPFAKFFVMKAAQHVTSSVIDGFKTRFSPRSLSFWMNNPIDHPDEARRQQLFNATPKELEQLRDSGSISEEDRKNYVAKNSEFRVFSPQNHPKDWGKYFWEQTEYRYSFIYRIMEKVNAEYRSLWQANSQQLSGRKSDAEVFKDAQSVVLGDLTRRFSANPALPGYIEAAPFAFPSRGEGQPPIAIHSEALTRQGHQYFRPGEKISHPWFWQAFGKTKESFSPNAPFATNINSVNIDKRGQQDHAYWLNPSYWVVGNNWAQDNLKGIAEWVEKIKAMIKGRRLTYWQEKQVFPKDQILERNLQDPWEQQQANYDEIIEILSAENPSARNLTGFLPKGAPVIPFSVQKNNGQVLRELRGVYLPETIKRLANLLFDNPAFRGTPRSFTLESSGNPYDNVNFSTVTPSESGEASFDFVPVVGDLLNSSQASQNYSQNQLLQNTIDTYAKELARLDRHAQEERLSQQNRGDAGAKAFDERRALPGHVSWSRRFAEVIDAVKKDFPETLSPDEIAKKLSTAIHKEHGVIDATIGKIKIPRIDYLDTSILHAVREHLSGPNFMTFLETFGGDVVKFAQHVRSKIDSGDYTLEFADNPHEKTKAGGLTMGSTVTTPHETQIDQSRAEHEKTNGLFRDFDGKGLAKRLHSGITRVIPLDTGGEMRIPIGITEKLHPADKDKLHKSFAENPTTRNFVSDKGEELL